MANSAPTTSWPITVLESVRKNSVTGAPYDHRRTLLLAVKAASECITATAPTAEPNMPHRALALYFAARSVELHQALSAPYYPECVGQQALKHASDNLAQARSRLYPSVGDK